MSWEAWALMVEIVLSICIAPSRVGTVRTSTELTISAIELAVMAWLVLRIEGVM